jgi:hypothetical protein
VLTLAPRADDAAVPEATRRLDEVVRREFPSRMGAPSRREVDRGHPVVFLARASAGASLLVLGAREESKAGSPVARHAVSRCVGNARRAVEVCAHQQAPSAKPAQRKA